MSAFIQRGGVWVLCQALLLLLIVASGIGFPAQWDNRAAGVIGVVLLCVAGLCGAAGVLSLGQNLTPLPQPPKNARLVQGGIYRFIRHPLYTSLFCGALGWALIRANWQTIVTVLCLGLFFNAKARVEERALRQRFPEYAAYETKVKRFVPWVY